MDGVIEWMHDLVRDKCSRITGSQCNAIISNQLSGPSIFSPLYSTGLCLVADGYKRMPPFWSSDNKALERYHISRPGKNKENDKCVQGGVLFSCASEEREVIILHPFNVTASNVVTFLSWPVDASVVLVKRCFLVLCMKMLWLTMCLLLSPTIVFIQTSLNMYLIDTFIFDTFLLKFIWDTNWDGM